MSLRFRLCTVCRAPCSPGPRCDECRRLWTRAYNAARPELHGFYATPAWRKLSAEIRASAPGGRCHWCLKPTRRLVADHIVPLDQRPDLALERSNLVASCIPCNTRRGRNARLPDLTTQAPEHSAAGAPFALRPGVALRSPGRDVPQKEIA